MRGARARPGPGSGWCSPCSAAGAAPSTTTSRTASRPASARPRIPRPPRCRYEPPCAIRRRPARRRLPVDSRLAQRRVCRRGRRRLPRPRRASARRDRCAAPTDAPADPPTGRAAGDSGGIRVVGLPRGSTVMIDEKPVQRVGDPAATGPARSRGLRAAVQLLLGHDRRARRARSLEVTPAALADRVAGSAAPGARSSPAPPDAASRDPDTTPTARASTSGPSR